MTNARDPVRERHLLREMLRIRRFEEKCAELYSAGKIRGFLHLYIGEEAVAVGVMQALTPDDAVVATYRDPDGAPAYCANCEVADLELTVSRRRSPFVRMREHARLSATRSGHFEVGRRQPFAGIVKPHVSM